MTIRWTLNPMTRVLTRREDTDTERSPYEDRGRDWSYIAPNQDSQGFLAATRS